MDRYSPRIIRGVAAAAVSIFLVAGAAFAASAVMGPRQTSLDLVPAVAGSSPTETLEATETAEPTGSPKAAEPTKPTEKAEPAESKKGAETAEPAKSPKAAEAAEPTETPDVEDQSGDQNDQSGDDNDGDKATSTPGRTKPTEAPHGGNQGGNG